MSSVFDDIATLNKYLYMKANNCVSYLDKTISCPETYRISMDKDYNYTVSNRGY